HRSRMVQVCVDSPARLHEAEVAFWRALLGDRWAESPAPEFAGKWHNDAGSPLQLLFQRLDDAEGQVRAHLDHGTDDSSAEVDRLLSLGAEDVGPGHGWHVLRDAAGLLFCVTENSPGHERRDLG
ncbi:VOC family protein, partial [Nocardioides hankookensis]